MDIGTCPVCLGEYWDVVEHLIEIHKMDFYEALYTLGRIPWPYCCWC